MLQRVLQPTLDLAAPRWTLKRVANQQFLYERGGVYSFRRGVRWIKNIGVRQSGRFAGYAVVVSSATLVEWQSIMA